MVERLGDPMRNPLIKRIPRDLKKNASKYISMFLILVLTIMIGSGFSATVESTKQALIKCETENMLEDGYFETSAEIDENTIFRLESLNFDASGSTVSESSENTNVIAVENGSEEELHNYLDVSKIDKNSNYFNIGRKK